MKTIFYVATQSGKSILHTFKMNIKIINVYISRSTLPTYLTHLTTECITVKAVFTQYSKAAASG